MSAAKRQLTGFGEFLDWRPLEFVDKIPNSFICVVCGILPAFPRRLPTCHHVFCPSCYEKITQKGGVCPVDLRWFSNRAVRMLDSVQDGINELAVRCPNAPRGCTFVSKLSELRMHFLEQCCHGEVHCPRCGLAIPHGEALDHYLLDCPQKATDEDTSRKSGKMSASCTYDGAATTGSSYSRTCGGNSSSTRKSRSADSSPSGKGQSRAKSSVESGVRQVCSADSSPSPGVRRALTLAAVKQHLQSAPVHPTRSVSGSSFQSVSSSSVPSHRSSGTKIGSSTIAGQPKTGKASKSSEGTTKVPSQEAHFIKKLNSVIMETPKTPSVARADKPSNSMTRPSKPSTTTVAAASTAAQPRKEPSSDSAGKNAAATALPSGFAFCCITGVTDAESSLSTCEEVVLRSDSSFVADCAFRVHARLRRSPFGTMHACFSLCLCGGTSEAIAAWLLAKKVHVVLVHPWDQSRNMRMALAPNPDAAHQEGHRAGRWDFWLPTNELKLGDIESRGFVSNGAICVAVEIE